MKKISSDRTGFYKKGFPAIWFGGLAIFVGVNLFMGGPGPDIFMWVIPIFMAIVGVQFFRNLIWDLVDEVYDCGDSILVRNRGQEEMIPFSNIMNVNATTQVNPPRITLRLAVPGQFGPEITFSPVKRFSLNLFARDELADDLIARVDKARRR